MLQDKEAYDAALENFSVPLLPSFNTSSTTRAGMTVLNETALRYRFIDMTAQTEALFLSSSASSKPTSCRSSTSSATTTPPSPPSRPSWICRTASSICSSALVAQNKGVLSAAKRKNHFSMLTDEEVAQMQQAIKESHLVE